MNIFLCENLCHPDYVDIQPVFASSELLYFAIEVTDAFFCEDGIAYDTILINAKETGLIILDYDFDFFEWKKTCNYNLVLIGGPAANTIVRYLVNDGISVVDWKTSPGEWEYIENPYSSCDILIVAGADRDATRKAVQELINHF